MAAPAEALRRLREAAEDGRLEARARELTLVTVFGSVLTDPETAKDIDIAVAPCAAPLSTRWP